MLLITLLVGLIIISLVVFIVNRSIGFILMQFAIAFFVVYATYFVSLWVLNRDKLLLDTRYNATGNSKTLIVNGYADSFNLQETMIDTINPTSMSFAHLPRSINRYGGAQFTYQFWMLLQNTNPDNIGFKDILVRGDTTTYNLMTVDNRTNQVTNRTEDIIIKCPRIRFNGSFDNVAVEVNTMDDPNPPPMVITSTSAAGASDTTLRRNIMRLVPNKWVLYTYVFQDNIQVNDFENGVEMRFYINDMLYQTNTMRSAIRQNNGHLYLFPNGGIEGCKIGNLAYYNYAVPLDEINKTYNDGPPNKVAVSTNDGALAAPLYLSEYNKLDIYNS